MAKRKSTVFVGDFETTVYKGQDHTEVWAAAIVELHTEDVKIFHSLPDLWNYMKSIEGNITCYFHNLKFDGGFWLPFLLNYAELSQAVYKLSDSEMDLAQYKEKDMPNNSFRYSISDMGQWYSITIKINKRFIYIYDSLKLLPFSVRRIGKSFKTKHQKLDMEYKGFRYAGCEITDEEKEYIANDVLVVKEALEIMFEQGHDKLTIGSCCLSEYKSIIGMDYKRLFPDLTKIEIDPEKYGALNADEYIRRSYKGGWCYLVPTKAHKRHYNGTTADVNSLYPSMMSSESGNYYPIGAPEFWKGNYLPILCNYSTSYYYFIRIKTRFHIKQDKLPCIQIKNNILYPSNQWLTTSDIYDKKNNCYRRTYVNDKNEQCDTRITLTLTMTDFKLIQEHYDLEDFEILDGCYFRARMGIFDEYIEKYKKIKLESTGALRELAKLFLNNLYGKLASNTNSSWKYAFLKEDRTIGFLPVIEHNKKAGYIAAGSAITSYARNFTIRAAQKNYHGENARGFIYADTDSIHCDLAPTELIDIPVHDKNFCHWKLESCWDIAWFTRQKTYIEHIVQENCIPIENPYFNVKCAGMPERCKDLFIKSMTGYVPTEEDKEKLSKEQLDFLKVKRDYEDFDIGLQIYGKLKPKRVVGGIILVDEYYTMH